MNGPAVSLHPGNKVTIAYTLNDPKDLLGKKENTIQESKALSQRLSVNEQETPDKNKKEGRPPLMSRRTSLFVKYAHRRTLGCTWVWKRGYEGISIRWTGREKKESGVDPLDGMMTTSLCTTEL